MENWKEVYFESFPKQTEKTVVGTLKNTVTGGRVNCYYEVKKGKNVITIRSLDDWSYPHICTDKPYTPKLEDRNKEFKENIYPLIVAEYKKYIGVV